MLLVDNIKIPFELFDNQFAFACPRCRHPIVMQRIKKNIGKCGRCDLNFVLRIDKDENIRLKTIQPEITKLPPQIIGNIGLFHVCRELSQKGFNVVPTSRNTRAVDLIVGTEDFSKKATIQVKTSTTNLGTRVAPTKVGKKEALLKAKLADFWVFVQLDDKFSYAVRCVHVCRGDDSVLLVPDNSHWWYEPCYPTRDEKVRQKWASQKDEGGWRLIVDYLACK